MCVSCVRVRACVCVLVCVFSFFPVVTCNKVQSDVFRDREMGKVAVYFVFQVLLKVYFIAATYE